MQQGGNRSASSSKSQVHVPMHSLPYADIVSSTSPTVKNYYVKLAVALLCTKGTFTLKHSKSPAIGLGRKHLIPVKSDLEDRALKKPYKKKELRYKHLFWKGYNSQSLSFFSLEKAKMLMYGVLHSHCWTCVSNVEFFLC